MAGHGCMHYIRLVSSAIGVFVGLSACLTFAFVYHHVCGAVYAFTSAVFAGVCLVLHILHHRNILQVWHSPDTLIDISKLGFCVFNIAFSLTAWYIFDGLYYHRPMMPIEENVYISAVWTFMTGKWGVFLWSSSKMYSRLLNSAFLSIP